MLLCRVVGMVVSQQKEAFLTGKKLLVCETLEEEDRQKFVAVDMVGAGVGSEVLVSRHICMEGDTYVDDRIVAIVDSVSG
ncbi:MAG: ethanolamine utilization protein EutN [Lachnospiraceae bacterium]|nr:ethanolamine utilization protein EutN [Lachnospiraceae bacterium]